MKLSPITNNLTDQLFGSQKAKSHSVAYKDPRINTQKDQASAASETRDMVRALEKNAPSYKLDYKGRKVFTAESKDKVNGYLKTGGAEKSGKEEKVKKVLNYNYKDVSSQIKRAKTSISAGQAVIKAKRAVAELKRKLSSSDEDKEEVMMALDHAKAVERVAKKKKIHLELEEMIEHTQEADENTAKSDQGDSSGSSGAMNSLLDQAEDKTDDAISKISEKQYEEFKELNEEDFFDEEDISIEEFMRSFGDDEMAMLEDLSDQLAAAEIVDPHMSKEDLSDLKIKHRNKEAKELLKADMDYLKRLADYLDKEKTASYVPAFTGGTEVGIAMPVSESDPSPSFTAIV